MFFISQERVAGALGVMEKSAWPGKAKWSDDLGKHLDAAQRASFLKDLALKSEQLPSTLRMTSFEDFSSPRPGFDDVYFSPAMQQETITPPPIVIWQTREIWIPLDVILAALFLGGFLWWTLRALKKQNALS